jgi:putative endonuclease
MRVYFREEASKKHRRGIMRRYQNYFVYMVASSSGTLYIGVTNSIQRRSYEHKLELVEGFSKTYHCTRLVYVEYCSDIREAIGREKQLKRWRREKKVWLIEQMNPEWRDLADDWVKGAIKLQTRDPSTSVGMTK